MDSHSDNYNRRSKAIAAIPMAGAIVTAALLLSGLSLISSYQSAIAQQNMTAAGNQTAGNMTAAGNQTAGNMTAAGNQTAGNMTEGGGGILESIIGGGGG
jgi:hypothetical protein